MLYAHAQLLCEWGAAQLRKLCVAASQDLCPVRSAVSCRAHSCEQGGQLCSSCSVALYRKQHCCKACRRARASSGGVWPNVCDHRIMHMPRSPAWGLLLFVHRRVSDSAVAVGKQWTCVLCQTHQRCACHCRCAALHCVGTRARRL